MTLFLSALAVSFVFAVVLWKLGDRRVEPSEQGRYMRLVHLASLLVWTLVSAFQTSDSWGDLTEAAHVLRAGGVQDTSALADKIESARSNLAVWGLNLAFSSFALLAAIADAIKAFMRRTSEKAAKLQETHA